MICHVHRNIIIIVMFACLIIIVVHVLLYLKASPLPPAPSLMKPAGCWLAVWLAGCPWLQFGIILVVLRDLWTHFLSALEVVGWILGAIVCTLDAIGRF